MSLENDSLSACDSELKEIGFKRKRKGIYVRPSTPSADGWVGLNLTRANLPVSLGVNPVVGVRHAGLESALLELVDGMPKSPVPSVTRPLGYLMPESRFSTWEFSGGTPLRETASNLVSAIDEYGAPFIETYSDWASYCALVDGTGLILDNQVAKVFPVIAILNGDKSKAETLLNGELTRVAQSESVYAVAYRKFAQRFRDRYLN